RGGGLLHESPGAVDPRVEDLPRLAVRRSVARREHVEAEVGIGRPAEIAEVPFPEQRIELHGRAGDLPQMLGGHRGAGEIAGEDPGDALALETAGQALGLGDATGRERDAWKLHDAPGVAGCLAVTDQEDQHTAEAGRVWRLR